MGIKQMLQKIYLHEFTEPQLKNDISLSEFKNGISIEDQKFLKVSKQQETSRKTTRRVRETV